MSTHALRLALVVAMFGVALPAARAQQPGAAPAAPAAPKDTLGRETPRGTVLGFMNASRAGQPEVGTLYLNTNLRDAAAVDLAHKLFVVLDTRLPPRLNELSDKPEGSLANPLQPDRDVVGTVMTAAGPLDLVVERVNRGALGPVWLFSRKTLDAIPDAYAEIDLVSVDRFLPTFATKKIGGIRLFQWLLLLVIFPVFYQVAELLARVNRSLIIRWRRRRGRPDDPPAHILPGFIRLLIFAIFIRWMIGTVELPLVERQFWTAITAMIGIASVAWALLVLDGAAERYLRRRLQGSSYSEIAALLRLGRRVADVFVIAAAVLVTLHYYGVDPTAALAGLGIGGIAVALAAQKTLENVIGGLSIIFDKAVRVGDTLKLGDTVGTVVDIGLRSTRIRTTDRTMVSVPNSQIANANIETLSARDKFWLRHTLGLAHETTGVQLRSIISSVRGYLVAHPAIDQTEAIRVRLIRLGSSSRDIDVVAYVLAADWEAFLETQQEMLLEMIEIVERAGAALALPSQRLHLSDADRPSPALAAATPVGLPRPPAPAAGQSR